MKKIAIIPARSGSKGLVNKNILMLLDKPILAYTIEAAIQSEKFIKVIVSTDSLEYKEIAEKYGAEVVMRGEELSNDSATSYMVIKDVLEKDLGVEYDYFVLLQPTSPFRNYQHINESIEKFEKNIRNYKEYYPNGAIFIGKNKEYLERKYFFGKKSLAYFMNKADSIDIDDRLDFEFAILLMSMKQKEKQLLKNIENRIEEKKEKFNKVEDITLIGHSIFDNWGIEMFQGYKVNNLGIRGINTIQYNNMIFEKELIKNIGKYVFLMAGTNDIVINNWKKEDTLLWINESIRYIEEMNRNTKIFFLEVPKVISRADRNNKIIEELNTYLKDNLESRIEYISLEKLEDKFGNLKLEYTYDGLHFNEKGYQKLLEILQEEIKL